MRNMPATDDFSPKQVARAFRVSESTLKRWCDQGLIASTRTAGGHRRIPVASVLQYARRHEQAPVSLELLGLPAGAGETERTLRRATGILAEALADRDAGVCRRILLDLYAAGHGLARIGDQVIREAFREIGCQWECGRLEVFRERRAVETCSQALYELQRVMPRPPADGPLAIGGTLQGDQYMLPTRLVELTFQDAWWQGESLGNALPVDTLVEAINEYRPRVFWLSVSHVDDRDALLATWETIYATASGLRVLTAIGGHGLDADLRQQMRYSFFGDTLEHLASFIESLGRGES